MSDRYRVGRTLGRTIYRQVGDEASKGDEFIGIMDTRAMATLVVATLNERTPRFSYIARKLKDGLDDPGMVTLAVIVDESKIVYLEDGDEFVTITTTIVDLEKDPEE